MRPCDVHADHRVQCLPFGGDRVNAVVDVCDFCDVRRMRGAVEVVAFDAAEVFRIGEYEFDYGVCHGVIPSLIKILWCGTDALNPREALFDIFVVVLAEQGAELIRRYIVRFHPLDKLGIKCFTFFDVPLYVGLELLAGAVITVLA